MDERLYEALEKLPRKNLIHLMWNALDEMQAWNGRSRQECIMLAIGDAAESKEKEDGTMKYTVKSLAKLKQTTENMGA